MGEELLSKKLFDISESMYDEGLYQWSDEVEKQSKVAETLEGKIRQLELFNMNLECGVGDVVEDLDSLKAKVAEIQELPKKWRDARLGRPFPYEMPENYALMDCADELEKVLSNDSESHHF